MQKIAPYLGMAALVIAAIALFVAMRKAEKPEEGKIYQQIADPNAAKK